MNCARPIGWTVYSDRDNAAWLVLENEDGSYMDSFSALTRVTLTVGETVIDSDVVGSSVIWWTDTVEFRGQTLPVIKFALGTLGLAVGTYTNCELILYDAGNTNGVQIQNAIKLTVV